MQLAQRKVKILKAIVESYIATGEPIGSKALCAELDFPVSSATVRNEMAELSELGLLIQPHTSAGRIPSEEGYRVYVNELMEKKSLPGEVKSLIAASLEAAADDPERILRKASDVTAELAHSAAAATAPSSETSRIRRLKFVLTGRQTCMVVLITSSGLIKNRLFKCDYVLTPEIVRIFETSLNKKLVGAPVDSLTPAYMQTLAVEFGELAMLMPSVLAAVMDACEDVRGISVAVAGKLSLLFSKEHDLPSARALMRFLNSDEEIEAFATSLPHEQHIIIGSEIGQTALSDFSVISSPYSIEQSSGGLLIAIAPMRTDYAYISAVLDYTAECVGRLIRDLLMLDSD